MGAPGFTRWEYLARYLRAFTLGSRGDRAAAGVDFELALESVRASGEAVAALPAVVGLARAFLRKVGATVLLAEADAIVAAAS